MPKNNNKILKMNIKIYLAELRGYCAGVHRAIDILNKAIEQFPTPIYVNHEIIHNKYIINYYEKKGIIFGEDLKNIPENSIMIMSAHGVGPEYIKKVKEKNIKYIDASCPLVVKVHNEAKKFLSEGYEIIYIGKKGHQEAEGVKEEDKNKINIISNIEDLNNLSTEGFSSLALLTQTTLSVNETKDLISKITEKYPEIILPKAKDICYATTNRQEAVEKICEKQLDLLIIIGSKNSSNSTKLKEIGEKKGIKSILIDSSEDIFNSPIIPFHKGDEHKKINIGISSGASVPEILVKEVLDFFKNNYNTEIEIVKTIEENIIFPSNLELK
ncbi:MAG: 4-hydroxy-3-methylbut-2-enyl diphosphate reductase [Candidatus Gracilibacteria bacterium]|nr:4-hydroxy-3-methylbut-2-enyl diphosphate reductase [Candidatus Gracilibacteria bacterium]MDQ7022975.1 4-hydroxy-3-methylbut-2-enyl diphosphate reductase [Candidatus Gracilibacteria bacterium]